MPIDHESIIQEIDAVLKEAELDQARRGREESSFAKTLMLAAIDRLAPPASAYREQARKEFSGFASHLTFPHLVGILKSLRADYSSGRLRTLQELIHADIFSDYLGMAQYLLEQGYMPAAAVIAGTTLEGHLHKLCDKFQVTLRDNKGRYQEANTLNELLRKAGAYDATEQKNVTAWLALRNLAAHGQHDMYTTGEIKILILSLREFISRRPA
jgi:hypothetical protein